MAPKKQHSSAETIKKRNRPTDTPMEVAGSRKNPGSDQARRSSDMTSMDPTLGSFANPNNSVAKSVPPSVSSLTKASRSSKKRAKCTGARDKKPSGDGKDTSLAPKSKSVPARKQTPMEVAGSRKNPGSDQARRSSDMTSMDPTLGSFANPNNSVAKSVPPSVSSLTKASRSSKKRAKCTGARDKKPSGDGKDTSLAPKSKSVPARKVEGLTAKGRKSKDDGKAKQGKSKLPSRNKPVSKNKVNICLYLKSRPGYKGMSEKVMRICQSIQEIDSGSSSLFGPINQCEEEIWDREFVVWRPVKGSDSKTAGLGPHRKKLERIVTPCIQDPKDSQLYLKSRPGYKGMSEKVMRICQSIQEIDSGSSSLFARRNPTFEEIWEGEFGVPYPVRKPDSKTAGLGCHRKKLERIVTPCIQDPKDSQLNRLSGLTRATEHSRQGMELSSLKRLNRLSGLTRATEHSRQGMELSSLKRFPPVPESTELPPPLSKPQTAEFPPVPESTELPPPLSKPQTAEIPHVPESTELPPPLLKSQVAKPNELSSLPKSTKLSRQRMKLASLKRFLPAPEIAQFPPPVTKSQMDMRMGSPGRPKSTKLSRQRMELAPFKLVAAEETTCASRSIFADCTPISTTRTPRRFKADSCPTVPEVEKSPTLQTKSLTDLCPTVPEVEKSPILQTRSLTDLPDPKSTKLSRQCMKLVSLKRVAKPLHPLDALIILHHWAIFCQEMCMQKPLRKLSKLEIP